MADLTGFQIAMLFLGVATTSLLSILTFVGLEIRKKVNLVNGTVQKLTVRMATQETYGKQQGRDQEKMTEVLKAIVDKLSAIDVRCAINHPK